MEKVQWNSTNKKQNGLKYSKNDKSSTLLRTGGITKIIIIIIKISRTSAYAFGLCGAGVSLFTISLCAFTVLKYLSYAGLSC